MTEPIDQEFKEKNSDQEKLKLLPIIFSVAILIIGYTFKLLHWPMADISIILGYGIFCGYNISIFLRLRGSNWLNNVLMALSLFWIYRLVSGAYFYDGHPFNFDGMVIFFCVVLISIIIEQLIRVFRR